MTSRSSTLRLPRIDGLELVRRVRRESALPIIVVSARGEESSRIAGLDAGADDYVVKPCSLAEISARVRALVRRARGFAAEYTVVAHGSVRLDLAGRRCFVAGHEVELTRREFNLLAALLRSPGHIRTREQLLELAWGSDDVIAKTVDVHVASIRRKLGAAIKIATVRGVGYGLEPA